MPARMKRHSFVFLKGDQILIMEKHHSFHESQGLSPAGAHGVMHPRVWHMQAGQEGMPCPPLARPRGPGSHTARNLIRMAFLSTCNSLSQLRADKLPPSRRPPRREMRWEAMGLSPATRTSAWANLYLGLVTLQITLCICFIADSWL